MPYLSIIVPIFNVDQYLNQSINSILLQTYTDFELILVDDGSTDNSGEICDQFSKKDNRVKVIHKTNGGVSTARNAGIDAAKGEYIAFVDPDDVIEPHMYEVLIQSSLVHYADMIVCQYTLINQTDKSIITPRVWKHSNCIIDKNTIIEELIPNFLVNKTFSLAPCINKLYKKSLFATHNIRFDENKHYGEDKRLNFTLLTLIDTLVFIDQPLYKYLLRKRDSLSQIFREDFYTYILEDKNYYIEVCKKYNLNRYIKVVSTLFTTKMLTQIQVAVKRNDISKKQKLEMVSKIINNEDFNKDIKTYKMKSAYYKLLKFICILRNERFLIKLIQMKYKIRSFL